MYQYKLVDTANRNREQLEKKLNELGAEGFKIVEMTQAMADGSLTGFISKFLVMERSVVVRADRCLDGLEDVIKKHREDDKVW